LPPARGREKNNNTLYRPIIKNEARTITTLLCCEKACMDEALSNVSKQA